MRLRDAHETGLGTVPVKIFETVSEEQMMCLCCDARWVTAPYASPMQRLSAMSENKR